MVYTATSLSWPYHGNCTIYGPSVMPWYLGVWKVSHSQAHLIQLCRMEHKSAHTACFAAMTLTSTNWPWNWPWFLEDLHFSYFMRLYASVVLRWWRSLQWWRVWSWVTAATAEICHVTKLTGWCPNSRILFNLLRDSKLQFVFWALTPPTFPTPLDIFTPIFSTLIFSASPQIPWE